MNSSTGVDHSVALGAEQKPIWCYAGIDLFVSLQIDSTESTRADSLSSWASSDDPRSAQVYPHALVSRPAGVAEESPLIARTLHNGERKQFEISQEDADARSRAVEEPSCTHFAPGERENLDGEVPRPECRVLGHIETKGEQIRGQGKQSGPVEARRSAPGVAVRRFIAKFVSPLAVQRYEHPCLNYSTQNSSENRQVFEGNDQPGERSSEYDHEKVCDPEVLCRQCKSRFPSRGDVVTGCRCLAVNHKLGELKRIIQEDLENQPKDQPRMGEEFYSCDENRRWIPQVEDYSWVPVDMNKDPDSQLTGCAESSTDSGEELDHDSPSMPSLHASENDVVGRILHNRDHPNLDTLVPSKFPDIESFDLAEILAACQLVKMSAYDCRNVFSEQELSAMKGCDVNSIGFRDESNEGRLSKIVERMHATFPDIHINNSRNALQVGVAKMDLSPWSDEDRYIPRIARRARCRLRGSQFSTRIDFGNTELDEDSDCEISQRPPRKRQYKSTQELLLA